MIYARFYGMSVERRNNALLQQHPGEVRCEQTSEKCCAFEKMSTGQLLHL
jgi:hypothetical protein